MSLKKKEKLKVITDYNSRFGIVLSLYGIVITIKKAVITSDCDFFI